MNENEVVDLKWCILEDSELEGYCSESFSHITSKTSVACEKMAECQELLNTLTKDKTK